MKIYLIFIEDIDCPMIKIRQDLDLAEKCFSDAVEGLMSCEETPIYLVEVTGDADIIINPRGEGVTGLGKILKYHPN